MTDLQRFGVERRSPVPGSPIPVKVKPTCGYCKQRGPHYTVRQCMNALASKTQRRAEWGAYR